MLYYNYTYHILNYNKFIYYNLYIYIHTIYIYIYIYIYTYTVINFVYTILHKCTQNTHKKAQRLADEEVPSTPISSIRAYMDPCILTRTLENADKKAYWFLSMSASPFILPTRYMLTSPPLGHWFCHCLSSLIFTIMLYPKSCTLRGWVHTATKH